MIDRNNVNARQIEALAAWLEAYIAKAQPEDKQFADILKVLENVTKLFWSHDVIVIEEIVQMLDEASKNKDGRGRSVETRRKLAKMAKSHDGLSDRIEQLLGFTDRAALYRYRGRKE